MGLRRRPLTERCCGRERLPTEERATGGSDQGYARGAAGESLLAPSITRRIIEEFAKLRPRHDITEEVKELTEPELEVLRALALGFSNAERAERLHVTEGTVKAYASHLLAKLGLRDRVQAVVFAYERGLVHPSAPNVTSVETRP